MVNLIIFIIVVLAILIISIMYIKSVQINKTETRYNVVMRFLIVILLTIMFLENKQQTLYLNEIAGNIQAYLSDAGKTLVEFIDNRTKDINERLNNIDNRTEDIQNNLNGINNDIVSINKNIDSSKDTIIYKISNMKTDLLNEINKYIENLICEKLHIGPGGVRTIW